MNNVQMIDANLELSLSYTQDVINICQPLFDNTIVTYFNFARKYNDGSNISLSTHAEWAKCYYRSGIYNVMDEDTDINLFRQKEERDGHRNFFRLEFQQCIAGQTSSQFGVETDLALLMLTSDYCDYYFFGANSKVTIEEKKRLYIKKSEIFPHFIFYFHEKAENMINLMHNPENRILKPNKEIIFPADANTHEIAEINCQNEKLFDALKINKYRIVIRNKEFFLTKRESECLALLTKVKTLKEIGHHLNLSVRTVETHLDKIKEKLGCHTRSQLIDFIVTKEPNKEIKSNMLAVERVLWKGN